MTFPLFVVSGYLKLLLFSHSLPKIEFWPRPWRFINMFWFTACGPCRWIDLAANKFRHVVRQASRDAQQLLRPPPTHSAPNHLSSTDKDQRRIISVAWDSLVERRRHSFALNSAAARLNNRDQMDSSWPFITGDKLMRVYPASATCNRSWQLETFSLKRWHCAICRSRSRLAWCYLVATKATIVTFRC